MFWKIYFVFIVLISIPLYLSGASGKSLEFITDLGFLLVQLVSIYGLAWEKKILSRMFWRIYFPLCVAWNLGHAYFTFEGDVTIVFTLIYSPLLYGTYLYAFRRDNLWSQEIVLKGRSYMSRQNILHLSVSGLTLLAAYAANWLMFGATSPARKYFLWHVGLPNVWRRLNLIPLITSALAGGNMHRGNEAVFLLAFTIQWSLVGLVFSFFLLLFRELSRNDKSQTNLG